ncbi:MAG: ATP synthase subunit I [Acidimicrobiales bacterium]
MSIDAQVALGPPVERQVAVDMARRALFAAPVVVGVASAFWGIDGGISAAVGLALAVGNLLLAAALMSWAAKVSLVVLAATVLGGYIGRLVLLTAVVFAIRNQSWVSWIPLAFTLVLAHLGLLIWETRYVSASLAFPALKPRAQKGV